MIPANIKSICIAFDILSVIICLLLQFDFGSYTVEIKTFDKRIFNKLVLLTQLLLVTDALSWLFSGVKEFILLNKVILIIYYSTHLFLCTMWIMYCDYIINEDEAHSLKVRNIFLVPALVAVLCSVLSYKYPIIFKLTSSNEYYRGNYYPYFIGLCLFYLMYSVYLIIGKMMQYHKAKHKNKKLFILIVYPVLPVVGVIIQTLFFGVNIIWSLTTISLLIVYFNFQNALLVIDPLTKLNNRYVFEGYLKNCFDAETDKIKFLSIIDLDKFKSINDNYGHLEGDKVLKIVSEILLLKTDKDDLLARLGGDEFAIFGTRNSIAEIEELKKEIKLEIDNYNKNLNKEYDISLSMGYSLQDSENVKSKTQMFIEADENMYVEKRKSAEKAGGENE